MIKTLSTEPRERIRLERVYRATIDEVWELWTTKDGIESWWGPGGFRVTVRELDLRPGGQLLYAMTAIDPPQVAFMKKAGMPITQECSITFTDVVPPRLLSYTHVVDFVPGIDVYDVSIVVELHHSGDNVRLVLTLDPMHDDEWTRRAVMGWEAELGKLATAIDRRVATPPSPARA